MNEHEEENGHVLPRRLSRSFLRDGKAVLVLDGTLPEIRGSVCLNAYYGRLFRQLAGYCAEELVPELPELEEPIMLDLTYQVRLVTPVLMSLTLDLVRRDGRAMPAARFGTVWSRKTGFPLPIQAFFPKASGLRRRIRQWVRSEALERLGSGFCLYDPMQAEQADRLYSLQHFYAAERGLVLYFPPLTLGGAAEGIPEFLMPWGPAGPMQPES